jgi:AraC family transcriptional regulator
MKQSAIHIDKGHELAGQVADRLSVASNTVCGAIERFLRGRPSVQFSSHNLAWPRIVLEKHAIPPGELEETAIDCSMLMLWHGTSLAHGERLARQGRFVPYAKQPGMMTRYAPGAVASVRPSTTSNLCLCAIDPAFLQEMREESQDESSFRGRNSRNAVAKDEPAFFDIPLRNIVNLLATEARNGGPSGLPYAEHLAHALALRIVALEHGLAGPECILVNAIRPTGLQRVIERIETEPTRDFDIQSMAILSGYSRSHFLRTFHRSMGCSPHQYVLRLRLERAKAMMHERSFSLLEVAFRCGFSSDAHLSRAFRQRFGVSPGEYRRRR